MPDDQKPYFHLFNAVTDALAQLDDGRIPEARFRLAQAQCDAEELFISSSEAGCEQLHICPNPI